MVSDLSDAFRVALNDAPNWTADTSNAAIHAILDRIGAAVDDWDASSGEEWVQFIVGEDAVLYLRIDFPLAIVLSGYEVLLEGIEVIVITADDFLRAKFRLDPALLPAIFSHTPDASINPNSFTIYELWRAST